MNKELLEKQKYKIVGRHSAVKLCLWTKESIKTGGAKHCYKQKFYPDIVKSHLCMQCTPAVSWCTLRCQYCWRPVADTTTGAGMGDEDEPVTIIEDMIKSQRQLLSGLGGVPHSEKLLKEANNPKNVALSLSGEPFCYSRIGELIREFHRRKMTTFVVTNGTFPERVESLDELPVQFYVSLCSNSKEMFKKVHSPLINDGWERLMKTLEIFSGLKTRTVVRLTLARHLNFSKPDEYAKLIRKASPRFVEIKAAMPVGFASYRMQYNQMLRHEEIKEFSELIAKESGYEIVNEKKDSRVVLLQ